MIAAFATCSRRRAASRFAPAILIVAALAGGATACGQAPASVYSRVRSPASAQASAAGGVPTAPAAESAVAVTVSAGLVPPAAGPVQPAPAAFASEPGHDEQAGQVGHGGQAGPSPVDAAAAADRAAQAERIVASSLASFNRAESVAVKLRQRVRVGDRVLVGTGRYLQAGRGDELRFRFETTLTGDTETFEIAEICDGFFCWLHRRAGPDPATLHRIDVQRVRNRLQELSAPDPADTAMYLGGLQRVLWSARQWFDFSEAVPGDLDGRPVWFVEGRWNPLPLGVLQPARAEIARQPGGISPDQLPDGMPWAIRFAIGRSDLVPYRLEYLAIPGPRPATGRAVEPIGVIDLVEIEFDGSVDPTAFFYQPATEGLIDITDPYCRMLGLMRP